MELTDINGNLRKWNTIREKEFKSNKVQDLNKENSKITIKLLKDFELGVNTTTKGKRSSGSLLRLRQSLRLLGIGINNKPFNKITREQLTKICDKKDSEDFTKNVKIIYNWLFRTGRIKENISNHLVRDNYNKGKPVWVYLEEEEVKTLINSANSDYRSLLSFIFDSGVRPQEAWKIRLCDFREDYTILTIPKKRKNGEVISKTFERTIKLKLCSSLLKDYIKLKGLKDDDLLITITQAGFNKYIRSLCKKLFGTKKTKAGESPDKITATDIRHNSACFWHLRYKKNQDCMYRMGWKKESKVFYYTEFLNLRDTIDDEDLITKEDKTKYEKQIGELKNQTKTLGIAFVELVKYLNKNNLKSDEVLNIYNDFIETNSNKP